MKVRTTLRRLADAHIGATALVLIYHRVARLDRDPQLLAVRPENFEAQMRFLAEEYRPLALSDLLDGLSRKRVPDKGVVVTFDDGYADNLLAAAPILDRNGIPATVFVSSGYIESGREFWWDEIERIVLGSAPLPETIEIEASGARFATMLTVDAVAAIGSDAPEDRWDITQVPRNGREKLYAELCAFVRPLDASTREKVLSQLRALAGEPAAPAPARESHRPLTAVETAQLDSSALIAVGGHTMTHQVLAHRTSGEQRAEIANDRARLTALLGHDPLTFSYPYGSLDDYTDATVALVRDIGYAGACSNHPGVVKHHTDPYRLPRQLVRDWDVATFAAHLEGWFGGRR
ncbi:MAG: hypothetical protein CVT60_01315 [Actinobacteria bacterium HGW-Actinobacteria-10]|nr:MAG: hypothetical protein CVT60_01315 [Actinobacteria bacterium HGW-Actinobacteria-10]